LSSKDATRPNIGDRSPSGRRELGKSLKPEPEPGRPLIIKERSFIYDILGAAIILLVLIGSLYTYTGNWPPLVVVQSGSMQHSDSRSYLGAIDTGDLVLVKSLGNDDRIVPYVEGKQTDHRTYGSWGDVIVFKPNGDEDRTAIIHRCVVFLVFNSTTYDVYTRQGGSYDVPSMGLYNVRTSFAIPDYEWPENVGDVSIDIDSILSHFRSSDIHPHDGYITKGDDNQIVDQVSPFDSWGDGYLLPVKEDWVIGKSRGELPWFGIIKLKIEGKSDPPENSVRALMIAIVVLVLAPFLIDLAIHLALRSRKKDEPAEPTASKRPSVPPSRRVPAPPPRNRGRA